VNRSRRTARVLVAGVLLAAISLFLVGSAMADMHEHKSGPFQGAKANTGFVTHAKEGGKSVLLLSDDFTPPDTPDPHWQLVDSKGNVYLLNKLKIKNDGYNKKLVVPGFVKDVKTVQIWCAWAETLLGEASFEQPVK
jgi:hypothetical protein